MPRIKRREPINLSANECIQIRRNTEKELGERLEGGLNIPRRIYTDDYPLAEPEVQAAIHDVFSYYIGYACSKGRVSAEILDKKEAVLTELLTPYWSDVICDVIYEVANREIANALEKQTRSNQRSASI